MTKRNQLCAAAFVLFASAAIPSCTSSQPSAPSSPASPATQPLGAHWIHDNQLRQVMARLSQRRPTMPQGIPQEVESPKPADPDDFNAVAILAGELMTSSERLPIVADKIQMSEADRAGFLAEAQTLHKQAQRLRQAARAQRIEQMQREMNSINSTCIACHSRYRDFAGQLDSIQSLLPPDQATPSTRIPAQAIAR